MSTKCSPFNIVYIHTHDSGRCFSPYGYPSDTPNLQALASESYVFRNAHSTAPTCSPSRSSLLTGTYPHENGMLGLAHRGFSLYNYQQHLVPFLKSLGYNTALSGVQHVAPHKKLIGYDHVLDNPAEYFNREINDLASYDLENAKRTSAFIKTVEKPFFLSFGMLNTHRPFPAPSKDESYYTHPPAPLPDTREIRQDTAGFHTALRIVDECVEKVLEAISKSGKEKETLIIFTSDHGPAFPDMKATLHDSGTGVALIMRLPDTFAPTSLRAPQVFDTMVSQLDIFPTICELLEAPQPHQMQGSSLLPLLRGDQTKLHDYLFSETNFHAAYEPSRAIRSDRYKLIRHFSQFEHRLPVNVDDSITKEYFHAHKYFTSTLMKEELFDIALDPLEQKDLSTAPHYYSVKTDLQKELHAWMKRTKDPLLQGQLSRPDGAIVNSPRTYSPESGELE